MAPALARSFGLAAWYVAHLLLLFVVLSYAFPTLEAGIVRYPSVMEVFEIVRHRAPFWIPEQLPVFLALVFVLLSALGWLVWHAFTAALRRLRLTDASVSARHAIVWAARNFFASGVVWLNLALAIGIATTIELIDSNVFALAVLIACLALTILLPLLFLNRTFLGTGQPGILRDFEWPGWRHLALIILGYALFFAWDILLAVMPVHSTFGQVTLQALGYLVDVLMIGILLSIFIYRIPPARVRFEIVRRTTGKFIASWLVLDAHIAVIVAWLAPPILVATLANIHVVPQLLATLDATGEHPGAGMNVFGFMTRTFLTYWFLIMVPLATLASMAYGKFLLLWDTSSGQQPE